MRDLPDYLKPLEVFTRPFPREAVEATIARREEAMPILVEVIRATPERFRAGEMVPEEMLHDYAMHLLAEFGETVAYRPMVQLARLPELDDLIGDGITEDLPKLLAAVWDGDCEPLFELIADPYADEFARGSGIQALGILYHSRRLERAALFEACSHIYQRCLDQNSYHPWDAWIMLVSDFGFTELADHITKAYAKGLAYPGYQPERDALKTLRAEERDMPTLDRHYKPYAGAIKEISGWVCFSDSEVQCDIRESVAARNGAVPEADMDESDSYSLPESLAAPETFVRGLPKVGRNDPCPCGSGKKFKKCCLD